MWRMALILGIAIPTQALVLDLTKAFDNRTSYGKIRWYQGGHTGTHLDAPCKYGGSWCAENIPIERLFEIPAFVLEADEGTVSVADLRYWEKHHGRPPKNGVLLLRSARGLNADAADWAARNMHVVAIGTDGQSIGTEQVMKVLSRNNVYAMEGLTHVDDLPLKGIKLYVFPTKIKQSTSVPVRVMAYIKGGASQNAAPYLFVLIFTAFCTYSFA